MPTVFGKIQNAGFQITEENHLPYIKVKKISADSALVTCDTLDRAIVQYTTDGSEPGTAASRYSEPFKVSKGTEIKAVAIRENQPGEIQSVKF